MGQLSIEAAKTEGEFLDRLNSLVPQDSNTTEIVPLVLEFKPNMSYYCLKSISKRRINQQEYESIKMMQAYREEFVQSQSLTAVHFNPENIQTRVDFRWVESDRETADANAPAIAEGTT
jgi:hypothetical protein